VAHRAQRRMPETVDGICRLGAGAQCDCECEGPPSTGLASVNAHCIDAGVRADSGRRPVVGELRIGCGVRSRMAAGGAATPKAITIDAAGIQCASGQARAVCRAREWLVWMRARCAGRDVASADGIRFQVDMTVYLRTHGLTHAQHTRVTSDGSGLGAGSVDLRLNGVGRGLCRHRGADAVAGSSG